MWHHRISPWHASAFRRCADRDRDWRRPRRSFTAAPTTTAAGSTRRAASPRLSPPVHRRPVAAGHQPMRSHNGRYVIVFNGEIYNYRDFRSAIELEAGAGQGAIAWRGHSDTEVLLERSFDMASAARCNASSACSRSRSGIASAPAHLARDRFGEKPLYYGFVGTFLCSAPSSRRWRAPGVVRRRRSRGLGRLPALRLRAAPRSIYAASTSCAPGTTLTSVSTTRPRAGCPNRSATGR